MKILDQNEIKQLELLINMEIELINDAFKKSEILGRACIINAITSFKRFYLSTKYGKIIPSMCTEYRYFVVGLLNNVDESFKGVALKEVLMPEIEEINDEELLRALNVDEYK